MNLSAIKSLKPINLDEINKVRLMKRTDKKYLLPSHLLPSHLLPEIILTISNNYYMLEINNERHMSYHTVYFDTMDDQLYKCHHNGKLNRYKIRKRIYLETDTCFLEIKFKNNKGKTIKQRTQSNSQVFELSQNDINYLNTIVPFDTQHFVPVISNTFIRMTLANKNFNERCTIDYNIDFLGNKQSKNFENLVIIEVKQDGYNSDSPLIKHLNQLRIKSTGFSKYCMGRVLTDPNIKQNAFKAKLRLIEKLTSN